VDARWEPVNGRLRPFYDLLRPVTRHFPLPAQHFLDAGGGCSSCRGWC
jgi:hypothetical protein